MTDLQESLLETASWLRYKARAFPPAEDCDEGAALFFELTEDGRIIILNGKESTEEGELLWPQ